LDRKKPATLHPDSKKKKTKYVSDRGIIKKKPRKPANKRVNTLKENRAGKLPDRWGGARNGQSAVTWGGRGILYLGHRGGEGERGKEQKRIACKTGRGGEDAVTTCGTKNLGAITLWGGNHSWKTQNDIYKSTRPKRRGVKKKKKNEIRLEYKKPGHSHIHRGKRKNRKTWNS